jgi:hypothetical protein
MRRGDHEAGELPELRRPLMDSDQQGTIIEAQARM